jgi:hypothetical protein
MPDQPLLELSAVSFTAQQLVIKIKNVSGRTLDKTLAIEFFSPAYLMDERIRQAAREAAISTKPPGAKSLGGVVLCPQGWSIWARAESTESTLVMALFNDMDQATGDVLPVPLALAAGAEFTIQIPLDSRASRDYVQLPYSYTHGDGPRFDGKLELKGDPSEWFPSVELSSNKTSPTAIPPGTPAQIKWNIKDGVSATLRGPLPNGNSELTLSNDPQADFKIAAGFIEVLVGGALTYLLQAEVKRPGGPNVQVSRMLTLDTLANQYVYIEPHPREVLPHGLVEVDWAVWGVRRVVLRFGNDTSQFVELTQQTLGHFYQGTGVMRATASGTAATETCSIRDDASTTHGEKHISIIKWAPLGKPNVTGQPLGMAVIAPKLLLLTSDGLFVATVGVKDPVTPQTSLDFTKINATAPAQWLALASVGNRFVALRRTAQNDLEVAPYKAVDGTPDTMAPLNPPADLRSLVTRPDVKFDLVGLAGRAYVTVEASFPGGIIRRAFSVSFDDSTRREEPLLERLFGHKLLSFDNALYALERNSGRLLRVNFVNGKPESLLLAASAVGRRDGTSQSMIRDGFIAPVGRVLAVLGPTFVPPFDLQSFSLRNSLKAQVTLAANANEVPQDLVHNPQKNQWARTGHGLNVQAGAVAAFRGGDSLRLWIMQPDRETHTLALGSETLMAHDYVSLFPTKPLPPYLNQRRDFKITNNTGLQLRKISDAYRNQGLSDFSANAPVELMSTPTDVFANGTTQTFDFKYNDADRVQVRFLVEKPAASRHDYLLELTISGPDFSTATSVFKRLAIDQGTLSIADVQDTSAQYTSTTTPIVIAPPRRLIDGVKLRLLNFTTYELYRQRPGGTDQQASLDTGQDNKIAYDTPPFFVMAFGAGELNVNVDFGLPLGLEVSSGREPQRKLVRIDPDASAGLYPERLADKDATSYELKISYRRAQELDAVYIGDGVASLNNDAIYLPVALGNQTSQVQVRKIDPIALTSTSSPTYNSSGVFSTPNSVVLSHEFVFAMFGDNDVYAFDYGLQFQDKANFSHAYTLTTQIKCQYESIVYMLGMKQDKTNPNISMHFLMGTKFINKNTTGPRKIAYGDLTDTSLDAVPGCVPPRLPKYPPWVSPTNVSPMALSQGYPSVTGERGRDLAVCIEGGMFLVTPNRPPRQLKLDGTGREEEILFGPNGRSIYCLHSQASNPALRVSRIDAAGLSLQKTLNLPLGQDVADLTSGVSPTPGIPFKNQRSISMIRTADEQFLFVSHGKTIFRINAATMAVTDTYTMPLPCRVFHIWRGRPTTASRPPFNAPGPCLLLYAIGAQFRGDGTSKARFFQTQFYKIAMFDK